MKTFGTLLETLRDAGLLMETWGGIDTIDIDHVAGDSREVGPNGLFVAIRGVEVDGTCSLTRLLKTEPSRSCARRRRCVGRSAPRRRLRVRPGYPMGVAVLAAAWYDHPSHALRVVGVTGTNGKTTVAFLVWQALGLLGVQAGFIGTIGVRVGSEAFPAHLTTPDALTVQRFPPPQADTGCAACVLRRLPMRWISSAWPAWRSTWPCLRI